MNASMLAALFDDGRAAKSAVEQLVTSGHPLELTSLLMSDRTAEREFSVSRRTTSELEIPLQGVTLRLAMGLRPLASLGSPGSGTVAVGPVVQVLQRAGLGAAYALEKALERCGIDAEVTRAVAREVKNGAVLLAANTPDDPSRALFTRATYDAKVLMELRGGGASAWPIAGVVAAPGTPAGEQHARYEPLRQPSEDELARNRPRF